MLNSLSRLAAVVFTAALIAGSVTSAWAKGQTQWQAGWGTQLAQAQTLGRPVPQPQPYPYPQPYPQPGVQPYPQPQPYPYPQPQPNPYPPQGYTQAFANPMINGLPVDICASPKQQCNGEAATLFCQQRGFAYAVNQSTAIFPNTAHVYGGICQPELFKVCGGYTRIVCSN